MRIVRLKSSLPTMGPCTFDDWQDFSCSTPLSLHCCTIAKQSYSWHMTFLVGFVFFNLCLAKMVVTRSCSDS